MSRFAILAMILATAATATAAGRSTANSEPLSAPSANADELAGNGGPGKIAPGTVTGPIFPDGPPAESCEQNVPLTCPSSAVFTIERPSDYWKGVKTETLNTPLVAAIESNRAQRMWCQAPSEYVTLVKSRSVDLPRGVTAKLNSDRTGVVFSKRVSPLAFVPSSPNDYPAAVAGVTYCGVDCSDNAPAIKNCTSNFSKEMLKGKVTVNGKSTNVSFNGRVHGDPKPNPETNRLDITCSLTLRRDFLSVNLRNRPNDVIGTSGGQFMRGYDLKGSALSSACHGLASYTCQPDGSSRDTSGLPKCVSDRRDACISTFSAADPCKKREVVKIR